MRSLTFRSRLQIRLGAATLALLFIGTLSAQALQVGTLHIESTPAGAEVELIGGKVGVTPLSVTERDIYPNNYPDARAALYGTVTVRHAGCEPLRHRVTLSDLKQDLHLRMDCVAIAAQATPPSVPLPVPLLAVRATAAAPTAPAQTIPQRRLRQLQVLQELLDEGLISPTEEQRVRRQILQPAAKSVE